MRITVFTPTYNRAYIITNLYNSLRRQTFKDFEWLIVDDGSTDNTAELIKSFVEIEDNGFSIRYYKKENGGKCRAINYALDIAVGELFFTVDSDDYLTDDALEKVNKWFNEIDSEKITGIVANRGYNENETVNYLFEEDYIDGSLLDIYTLFRDGQQVIDGERAFIFYTEFHRKYKYPEFANENFMTEAVSWNRMAADGYKVRFVNDIIWIFEYKEDGLTRAGSSLFLNNPKGYGLCLREKAKYLDFSFKQKLLMYYTFYCDMSERYSKKQIAEFIGAPKVIIYLSAFVHKLRHLFKKK